jgi:tetratricopeptide (TPR) repeat protein
LFLFFLIAFSVSVFPVFAQKSEIGSRPWWYAFEQGKLAYSKGFYGDALITFEDARRSRLAGFSLMEDDLILLLSKPEVRILGDNLEHLEMYIAEKRESRAAAALAELYHRVPKDSLKGSIKRALLEINRLKNYPEAEYWLGETYRAEGEPGLALRQYEKAWETRYLLESPEFEVEILYKIIDIYRLSREYQEMVKRADEIVEGKWQSGGYRDSLWAKDLTGSGAHPIRAAMARILENDGIARFFSLYRHNNTVTEKAHRLLGFFYYTSNRYSTASEHLMFAFLIQNTVLIDEAIRRQYNFTFTTLENLLNTVNPKNELSSFLDETEYYKTIYYFASALYASGKTRPAMQLWNFLAGSRQAGEWGERAGRNRSPVIGEDNKG